MELTTREAAVKATRQHWGAETVNVPAGQWVQLRYGAEEEPTTILEGQCPEGKSWAVALTVAINEVDD